MNRRLGTGLLLCGALLTGLSGCTSREAYPGNEFVFTGGDAALGKEAILHYGCKSCHTIPGIPGAQANVGPPLTRVGTRSYIGGVIYNTPENLVRWIQDPPAIDPQTAMPQLGISEREARHIASYLYTLR